jgi:hypothetical protein
MEARRIRMSRSRAPRHRTIVLVPPLPPSAWRCEERPDFSTEKLFSLVIVLDRALVPIFDGDAE